MLIAQITDTHIGSNGRSRHNADRLARVVDAVVRHGPDLVLLTGDLTEAGDAAAYRDVRDIVRPVADRLLVTVGNHDRRAPLIAAFGAAPAPDGFLHRVDARGSLRVAMLDTLDEGWETAAFCAQRARWLDDRLADAASAPTLLAMHHPPAASGTPWIDAKSEGNWTRRLAAVVARHPQVVALVAGHAHQPVMTSFAGRPLCIAPAVAFPVAHDGRSIDPARPDGRPLIVAGPPGYALHRWDGARLTTWFGTADDAPVAARFDTAIQPMIRGLFDEAATRDV